MLYSYQVNAQSRPLNFPKGNLKNKLNNKRDSIPNNQLVRPERPVKNLRQNPRNKPIQNNSLNNNNQVTQDTTEMVELNRSDELENFKEDGQEIRFLKGNIQMKQGNTLFFCDSAYQYISQNAILAWGEVTIIQGDSVQIFSDSLRYFGDTKDAYLIGNVVLKDSIQKLFTERLDYNLDTKIGTYFNGGLIDNGTSQLTSQIGVYNTDTHEAFFKDSVLIVSDTFMLKTDSLNYNTQTQFSEFLGPTLIVQDSAKIYCESGYYDFENKFAEFDKNPQYVKDDKVATAEKMIYDGEIKVIILEGNAQYTEDTRFAKADRIRYDEVNDITDLKGNAYVKDEDTEVTSDHIIYDGKTDSYTTEGKMIAKSEDQYIEADYSKKDGTTGNTILEGNVIIADTTQILKGNYVEFNDDTGDGFAAGDVFWQDTVNQTTILGDSIFFNKKTDYVNAIGRPLMTTIMDGDTLFLSADQLISKKMETDTTEIDELLAFKDVRMYKSDFQVVCDSMSYISSDSIFSFYYNPFIWSDSTQFSADTIHFTMKNEKIDSVFLIQNSFIIDTPDELFFNQVKGKYITMKFKESSPENVFIDVNSESVYYALDDQEAYIGVNHTKCSQMKMEFEEGDLKFIRFYKEPQSVMYPMKKANHSALQLSGFRWNQKQRPLSPADLNTPYHFIYTGKMNKNTNSIPSDDLPIDEMKTNSKASQDKTQETKLDETKEQDNPPINIKKNILRNRDTKNKENKTIDVQSRDD